MTQRIRAGLGVAAIGLLLIGASHHSSIQGTPAGTAATLGDLPLTSHFQISLGTVGNFQSANGMAPFSATMPAGAGIAISRLTSIRGQGSLVTGIRIDGVTVWEGPWGGGAQPMARFDPPIIVRPGETLGIGVTPAAFTFLNIFSLGGSVITAAQLGL